MHLILNFENSHPYDGSIRMLLIIGSWNYTEFRHLNGGKYEKRCMIERPLTVQQDTQPPSDRGSARCMLPRIAHLLSYPYWRISHPGPLPWRRLINIRGGEEALRKGSRATDRRAVHTGVCTPRQVRCAQRRLADVMPHTPPALLRNQGCLRRNLSEIYLFTTRVQCGTLNCGSQKAGRQTTDNHLSLLSVYRFPIMSWCVSRGQNYHTTGCFTRAALASSQSNDIITS